jgi:hypothetical protein
MGALVVKIPMSDFNSSISVSMSVACSRSAPIDRVESGGDDLEQAEARCQTVRGELAFGRLRSRHNLVFGGSRRTIAEQSEISVDTHCPTKGIEDTSNEDAPLAMTE